MLTSHLPDGAIAGFGLTELAQRSVVAEPVAEVSQGRNPPPLWMSNPIRLGR